MTPSYPVGLIWLRRDLRLTDNAAIYHATKQCEQLFCAFVFDDSILSTLPHADRHPAGLVAARLPGDGLNVDIKAAMLETAKQAATYRRTDTHWTFEGCQTGYHRLCQALGVTPQDFSDRKSGSRSMVMDLGNKFTPQVLEEAHFTEPNEIETRIGKHCAALIEDGATLQMGIGAIPNAVLAQLGNHKNLGIHTEMFADGVLPLVEKGVINGEAKNIDKGKMVSTFLMGSQRVYDFIDDNPGVLMMDVGYTNDPFIIAKNDRVTAINSALQVDITGQVCADSLGTKFYSGVGGQIDFIYGASLSKGGKAIIAMPSVTNKGISKIAPELTCGAGVVTTRNHIHWFVTENGAVNLYGKSLQERARLIISIADPSAQESLDRAAFERYGQHHHYVKNYMGK